MDFVAGPDSYADLAEVVGAGGGKPGRRRTGFEREWREIGAGVHGPGGPLERLRSCHGGLRQLLLLLHRPLHAAAARSTGRSRASLAEVRAAAAAGDREIQLLGQNVNSYRDPGCGPSLRRACSKPVAPSPGPEWVRFVTSHPKDFGDELVRAMAAEPKICPSLHLPVQSGSSRVLARMNRGYTREDYLALVDRLKRSVPGLLLTTDVIVGFPGETEEDFEETCALLGEVRFATIFSFRYSPRPLTAAAALPDDVPLETKRLRLIALQDLQKTIQTGIQGSFVGRDLRVLGTGPSPKGGGRFSGRTAGNLVVNFDSPADPTGRFVTVRITGSGPYSLHGVAL